MIENVFGVPYEFYLMAIALFIGLLALGVSNRKVLAGVSLASLIHTIAMPVIFGLEKLESNETLYFSWCTGLFVFIIQSGIWLVLELLSKSDDCMFTDSKRVS